MRRGQPRARGFTLLELLVAITLLGLIATLVTGGLRLGAKAWDVRSESFEQSAELQAVRGFLARQLSAAHPLMLATDDGARLAFEGDTDALTFATLMPAHLGLGGFYLVSLRLEDGAESGRLMARWRLFRAERDIETLEEEEEGGESLLLDGVEEIALRYFGALDNDERPAWHETWREQAALPSLIRATVRFAEDDRRVWPPLVVAPMPGGTVSSVNEAFQGEFSVEDE